MYTRPFHVLDLHFLAHHFPSDFQMTDVLDFVQVADFGLARYSLGTVRGDSWWFGGEWKRERPIEGGVAHRKQLQFDDLMAVIWWPTHHMQNDSGILVKGSCQCVARDCKLYLLINNVANGWNWRHSTTVDNGPTVDFRQHGLGIFLQSRHPESTGCMTGMGRKDRFEMNGSIIRYRYIYIQLYTCIYIKNIIELLFCSWNFSISPIVRHDFVWARIA